MLHSPKRIIVFTLAVVYFLLHELYLLEVFFPLLAVVVHLSLDLDQTLLYVLLHLLEVLDLLVVFDC